jgi:uncharacterized protein
LPFDGADVELRQTTQFPWDGGVAITIGMATPMRFALRLRIPDWCPSFHVSVNDETVAATALDRGYPRIERDWAEGDRIRFALAMPARRLSARSELVFDLGRVALQRGPFIYCVEETNAGGDVERLMLDRAAPIAPAFELDLLGGIGTLRVPVWTAGSDDWGKALYRDAAPTPRRVNVRAIPYPLWAHRGAGSMAVWLRSTNP